MINMLYEYYIYFTHTYIYIYTHMHIHIHAMPRLKHSLAGKSRPTFRRGPRSASETSRWRSFCSTRVGEPSGGTVEPGDRVTWDSIVEHGWKSWENHEKIMRKSWEHLWEHVWIWMDGVGTMWETDGIFEQMEFGRSIFQMGYGALGKNHLAGKWMKMMVIGKIIPKLA